MEPCPKCNGSGYWYRTGGDGRSIHGRPIPCDRCWHLQKDCEGEGFYHTDDGTLVTCYGDKCH